MTCNTLVYNYFKKMKKKNSEANLYLTMMFVNDWVSNRIALVYTRVSRTGSTNPSYLFIMTFYIEQTFNRLSLTSSPVLQVSLLTFHCNFRDYPSLHGFA